MEPSGHYTTSTIFPKLIIENGKYVFKITETEKSIHTVIWPHSYYINMMLSSIAKISSKDSLNYNKNIPRLKQISIDQNVQMQVYIDVRFYSGQQSNGLKCTSHI